jgi:hypothetical protein
LAGAVIESPGVPVRFGVLEGVAKGVRVAGSVAVIKPGVGEASAGAESVIWQALSAAAVTRTIKCLRRMAAF